MGLDPTPVYFQLVPGLVLSPHFESFELVRKFVFELKNLVTYM